MTDYQRAKYAVAVYISVGLLASAAITGVAIIAASMNGMLWVFACLCYANVSFGLYQWIRLRRWRRKQGAG